ncbi:MAG TPA: serine hydrolase domain-containing protein [Acidimicrobiales bacterium]|nr:serine hydrolase domain-containing protein [Acidimicrobiales bacterium]
MSGFEPGRLERLRELMADHVRRDAVGGVAWLAARDDDIEVGVAGTLTRGEGEPVRRDSIFRVSSMSKPILAAGALVLVEDCRLRLEDPVDELLPELADRRVLVDPHGPTDGETVPAERPITVEDVLTFRLGLGLDFTAPWPQPLLEAMSELGLGAGPPEPQLPPEPDEWMRRLSTLPLLYQPGERWLYHTGSDVLGVLIARASGQDLDGFLRERVLEPLGMADTGFFTEHVDRLSTCYARDPQTGQRVVYDAPHGQWAKPPAFPSGGAGLVSTVDDYHAFARLLLSGGRLPDGSRLLSAASVEAMTTDHLGVDWGRPSTSPDGSQGWGYGVGVQVRRAGLTRPAGSYGWGGGMGSSWANDPRQRLAGVLLTTDAFAGPFPPPAVVQDFWTCVYTSLAD